MRNDNLTRIHQPSILSMIGGGANGGSAKPEKELEEMNRKNGEEVDSPAGAGGNSRQGNVGGLSNDDRNDDSERAADPKDR